MEGSSCRSRNGLRQVGYPPTSTNTVGLYPNLGDADQQTTHELLPVPVELVQGISHVRPVRCEEEHRIDEAHLDRHFNG